MKRIRVEKDRNYTTINNAILKDPRISTSAKGLFTIIMSLPDNWDFSIAGISSIIKESRDATYRMINELIEFGYCERNSYKINGKFNGNEYVFKEYATPNTDFTDTEISNTQNKAQLSKDIIKEKKNEKKNNTYIQGNASLLPPEPPKPRTLLPQNTLTSEVLAEEAVNNIKVFKPAKAENIFTDFKLTVLFLDVYCKKYKVKYNDHHPQLVCSETYSILSKFVQNEKVKHIKNVELYVSTCLDNNLPYIGCERFGGKDTELFSAYAEMINDLFRYEREK